MAGGINFSGIGSGLDFGKLTEAILAERSRPLNQLQSRSGDYTKRSDALKQLNSRLAALTQAANALSDRDLGAGRQASSSDSSVATASVTDTAATGTIRLSVTRLATSLSQSSRAYADDEAAVLAGGATSATFELRKGGAASGTAITIDSTNNTLTGLRDAINNADAGVTASIVDVDGTGTSYKLVLNSTSTGSAGRVELVETSATGTGTDLGLTSTNPPGATTDFSDLNALFKINGLELTRSSNSVSDAVTGVTISLKGAGSTSVTVAARTSDLSEKVQNFIDAYNSVQDFISAQYTKDGKGRPSGQLAGDPTLRLVQRQLRDAVGGKSTDNGGSFSRLTEIGISRDDAGKLTLDSKTLNDKLAKSLSDVKALLAGKEAGDKGLANSIHTAADKLSDSLNGVVKTAIDGFQDSIKRTEQTMANHLARISSLRESLTRQFAAADRAISQLNGQGTSLTNVLKSLEPRNK